MDHCSQQVIVWMLGFGILLLPLAVLQFAPKAIQMAAVGGAAGDWLSRFFGIAILICKFFGLQK